MLVDNTNNKGSEMDPSTTPQSKLEDVGIFSWLFTKYFLLNTYDQNQSITSFETPRTGIFCSKILWSIVPKAFWGSTQIIPFRKPESKPSDILSVK